MTPRPIPYPAETRAKGWRFEVNMEQVKKSDTWLRARTGYVRAHLLLLWSEAWEQTPCGSLPDDDELLALLLDMEPEQFSAHRAVLMRGWTPADDGRLYHEVITERVLAMLEKRASDAKRAAARRERAAESDARTAGDTHESRVTNAEVRHEFDTKHQAPSTNTEASASVGARKRASRKCPDDFAVTEDMRELAEREAPHVDVDRETAKFRDHTFKTAIADWVGAWRNWIRRAAEGSAYRGRAPPPETTYARQMRERTNVLGPGVAAKAPGQPSHHLTVIDADGNDRQKRLA